MDVTSSLLKAAILFGVIASAGNAHHGHVINLNIPPSAHGASIKHTASYSSFSFEPAFWVEFFGNASNPNNFTFQALNTIVQHGGRPNIRPGGITMDSMIFNATAGDPIRTTNAKGGVYRTTVGPAYYQSWSNFPKGTRFTSTLNFGNNSLEIARGMAVASVKYQADAIDYFELGNEPTNYPPARWDNSTANYVQQWNNWTSEIGAATGGRSDGLWWASSATTDITPLHVRPADLIPAGIDSKGEVSQYSIHSYAFSTCDPARLALATTHNLLNHSGLVEYADTEIYPSAKAALDAGSTWIVGEFNSISCSGNPNVSDTFAQALWEVDTELIYASRNASANYLHQGATLVFQSNQQSNSAGDDGSPGFSTYDMLYPVNSSKRGEPRTLPGFVGLLFLAEAFAVNGTRVRALETPKGVDQDYFSAYALYNGNRLSKLALINMKPFYANSTSDFSVSFRIPKQRHGRFGRRSKTLIKRMTAPHVDEKAAANVTWAGQSFKEAKSKGAVSIEEVPRSGVVSVRGSEAVLMFFNEEEVCDRTSDGKGSWWNWWHNAPKRGQEH